MHVFVTTDLCSSADPIIYGVVWMFLKVKTRSAKILPFSSCSFFFATATLCMVSICIDLLKLNYVMKCDVAGWVLAAKSVEYWQYPTLGKDRKGGGFGLLYIEPFPLRFHHPKNSSS